MSVQEERKMINAMKFEMIEATYIKGLKDAGANVKRFPQLHKMVEKECYSIEYR